MNEVAIDQVDRSLAVEKEIDVFDLIGKFNLSLPVTNVEGQFCVSTQGAVFADSMRGLPWVSYHGKGDVFDQAIIELCENLSGKVMWINDSTSKYYKLYVQLPERVVFKKSCITSKLS